jgi:hypothetical protein
MTIIAAITPTVPDTDCRKSNTRTDGVQPAKSCLGACTGERISPAAGAETGWCHHTSGLRPSSLPCVVSRPRNKQDCIAARSSGGTAPELPRTVLRSIPDAG